MHDLIKEQEEKEKIDQRKLREMQEELDDNLARLALVEKYLAPMEKQIIVDYRELEEMNILAFNALSEAESAPDH